MAKEGASVKRTAAVRKDPNFVYPAQKKETKLGRGKRKKKVPAKLK